MFEAAESKFARMLGLTVVLTPVLLSACAGENLFSVSAAVGGAGTQLEITAPADGSTVTEGASVQVIADATAPAGVASAKFSGVFKESGEAAFLSETETFQSPTVLHLDNTLQAVDGAGTGGVYIILLLTDGLGVTKADTVSITVN